MARGLITVCVTNMKILLLLFLNIFIVHLWHKYSQVCWRVKWISQNVDTSTIYNGNTEEIISLTDENALLCNTQVLILVFWEKFFVQGRGYCFMWCNLCNVMQIIQGENLMHLNSSRACPLADVLSDASKVGNLIAYSMKWRSNERKVFPHPQQRHVYASNSSLFLFNKKMTKRANPQEAAFKTHLFATTRVFT